jgi:hypothetical protein
MWCWQCHRRVVDGRKRWQRHRTVSDCPFTSRASVVTSHNVVPPNTRNATCLGERVHVSDANHASLEAATEPVGVKSMWNVGRKSGKLTAMALASCQQHPSQHEPPLTLLRAYQCNRTAPKPPTRTPSLPTQLGPATTQKKRYDSQGILGHQHFREGTSGSGRCLQRQLAVRMCKSEEAPQIQHNGARLIKEVPATAIFSQ